jgi:hypothetical protein
VRPAHPGSGAGQSNNWVFASSAIVCGRGADGQNDAARDQPVTLVQGNCVVIRHTVHGAVGRTTSFRHFGDKTEVVFAKEHAMFDAIADATSLAWTLTQSVNSLAGALRALEPLVIQLCEKATADRVAYLRHTLLVDAHEELRACEALKHQYMSK